jgi:hypothetical protein
LGLNCPPRVDFVRFLSVGFKRKFEAKIIKKFDAIIPGKAIAQPWGIGFPRIPGGFILSGI